MNRSEQIGELIGALAKAQGEFTAAIKDVTSNAFQGRAYKYADLAANIGAIRPALSKHGIALLQFNESDLEHQTASVTTALHMGEQFISITAEAPAVGRNGFDIQSIGACWTYLRRYTLQALCGLASEDDDAEQLAGTDIKPIPKKTPPPPVNYQQDAPETPAQDFSKKEPPQQGTFSLVGDRLTCIVKAVTEKQSKKNTPYLTVTFNGRVDGFNYAFCYDTKFFALLKDSVNKEVSIQISPTKTSDGRGIQYFTIIGGESFSEPIPSTLTQELENA